MTVSGPLFRADHVGSLLRPDRIKQERALADAVELTADGYVASERLQRAENEEVDALVAMQEQVGLACVTDGEVRRSFWHLDFLGALDGLCLVERGEAAGVQFAGTRMRPVFPTISERLSFPDDHPMLAHFRYLAATSSATAKISIPGPSACHFRTDPDDITYAPYRDLEVLFADISWLYNKAVHKFYEAGCRYLQLDDIFFAYLCDEQQRESKRAQGLDPDWLISKYARMMRDAIIDRPEDMTIAMHLCRGNFQSTWVAEGGYDPVADVVFNETGVDVFYMEYDTDRAGGLEPLRLLAKGAQRIMPGFITTKTPALESVDELLRLFDAATRYVDIDQLGIAPQCGFASTEEGNKLSPADQQRKLALVARVAEEIWGGVV